MARLTAALNPKELPRVTNVNHGDHADTISVLFLLNRLWTL
jgi:hypothetical protein